MRVAINRRTGSYETFRRWLVVDDAAQIESPDRQMNLEDASRIQADVQAGGYVEILLENADFAVAALPRRPPSRSSSRRCGTPSERRSWTPICTARVS